MLVKKYDELFKLVVENFCGTLKFRHKFFFELIIFLKSNSKQKSALNRDERK